MEPGSSEGFEAVELEAFFLDGVLDTGGAKIIDDHPGEVAGKSFVRVND